MVDTANFLRDPPLAASDRRRAPGNNSAFSAYEPDDGLHVVERLTRLDRDALFYEFTVEDPDYTAPYSGSFTWPRTDSGLYEYACHEGNYSMGNTLRGARFLEEQWYEKQSAR